MAGDYYGDYTRVREPTDFRVLADARLADAGAPASKPVTAMARKTCAKTLSCVWVMPPRAPETAAHFRETRHQLEAAVTFEDTLVSFGNTVIEVL